jgi:hypothetical protein
MALLRGEYNHGHTKSARCAAVVSDGRRCRSWMLITHKESD